MKHFPESIPSWQFPNDSLPKQGFQHQRFRPLFLFACFLTVWMQCLLLTGCGGSKNENASPPPSAPTAPTPTPVNIPTTPNSTSTSTTPSNTSQAPTSSATSTQNTSIPPSDPHNSFLTGEHLANFEVVSPENQFNSPDPRAELAISPPEGTNSSHFTIIDQVPSRSGTKNPQLRLPANFVEIPDSGYDDTGWPLKIQSTIDQSIMAFIPSGMFIQGKDGVDPTFGPQHSAYVSAYYLDIHEVTLGNFMRYREEAGQSGERLPQLPSNSATGDQTHPALGIAWRDAQNYLERVGKQLPTEAEWEKGARGISGFDFPWGQTRPAWHQPRNPGQISTIMSYPSDQSVYGIYDMAGNAREWCQDWYSDDAYQLALKDNNQIPRDWTGPKKGTPQFHRVIKGSASHWHVWERGHASSNDRLPNVGFRGVLRIPK